ncbi:MAG: hypothetical protein JNM69_12635 [Archangium sp.]|nr:hypothetical protein [Archangium sp.]
MRLLFVSCVLVLSACGQQMTTPDAGNPLFLCDPSAPALTLAGSVQADLFDKQCKSCHNSFDATNGDFSDASRTADSVSKASKYTLKRVEPNDLGKSAMWLKLNATKGPNGENSGGVMPPGGMLPEASRKIIKDWICSGAK